MSVAVVHFVQFAAGGTVGKFNAFVDIVLGFLRGTYVGGCLGLFDARRLALDPDRWFVVVVGRFVETCVLLRRLIGLFSIGNVAKGPTSRRFGFLGGIRRRLKRDGLVSGLWQEVVVLPWQEPPGLHLEWHGELLVLGECLQKRDWIESSKETCMVGVEKKNGSVARLCARQ